MNRLEAWSKMAAALLGVLLLTSLSACGESGPFGPTAAIPAGSPEQSPAAELERRYAALRLQRFAEVPEITVAELRRLQQRGRLPLLVDVREPREQAVSMLPGAIGVRQFEAAMEATPSRYRDRLVVPYCTIGLRSGLYARTLQRRGMHTRNLAGSVLAWAQAGLPLEHAGRPTRRVHVYAPDWNLLPPGYQAVTGG